MTRVSPMNRPCGRAGRHRTVPVGEAERLAREEHDPLLGVARATRTRSSGARGTRTCPRGWTGGAGRAPVLDTTALDARQTAPSSRPRCRTRERVVDRQRGVPGGTGGYEPCDPTDLEPSTERQRGVPSMRIGMIAPPWLPVPPPAYGGTEAVLDGLVRGLTRAGHEVVLVAHPDSQTPGRDPLRAASRVHGCHRPGRHRARPRRGRLRAARRRRRHPRPHALGSAARPPAHRRADP